MKHFPKWWTILSTAALLMFSVYAMADTFLISTVYAVVDDSTSQNAVNTVTTVTVPSTQADEATTSTQTDEDTASAQTDEATASTQADEDIATTQSDATTSSISLEEYRLDDTTVYVAAIELASADALKTAFAQNAYGRNVKAKTSETAASVDAILAINGDYYGAQESGYVIRNGVLYRSTMRSLDQEDLVIYADSTFEIITEGEISAEELLESGAQQVLCFGPALIVDGEISVDTNDEVDKAMADNPRTAIGVLSDGSLVMVVSDGRTDESEGLSLYELAEFMQSLGCVTAYNLDGGGSSTMVYEGELVNNPTSGRSIKERAVSDIIYIAY